MNATGIKYISHHEISGNGIAARRYLHPLRKTGVPLKWTPMIPGKAWGMGYQPYLQIGIDDEDFAAETTKGPVVRGLSAMTRVGIEPTAYGLKEHAV